jgi:hypothetical protein
LGTYGKIFIVKLKEYMDSVESEAVARQANRNREWTQIYANTVEQSEQHKSGPLNGLTALPMDRIAGCSRLFESIRGSAPVLESSKSPYASR